MCMTSVVIRSPNLHAHMPNTTQPPPQQQLLLLQRNPRKRAPPVPQQRARHQSETPRNPYQTPVKQPSSYGRERTRCVQADVRHSHPTHATTTRRRVVAVAVVVTRAPSRPPTQADKAAITKFKYRNKRRNDNNTRRRQRSTEVRVVVVVFVGISRQVLPTSNCAH